MEIAYVGRLLAACVVVGLVLAAVRVASGRAVRLRVADGGDRLVTLMETTFLPGAASVHVLRVADRYIVVGRASGDVSTLCEISADRVAAHLAAPARAHVSTLAGVFAALARRGRGDG